MSSATKNHGLVDGRSYQLKIGSSFQPGKATESYHTMRYDFKPASVDTSRPAKVHIGAKNECTATIPNVHDSGTTTYKGGKKPCTKECILLIDKETGEITLERISSNIPLKKSRADRTVENIAKVVPLKNNPSSLGKHNKSSNLPSRPATNNTSNNLQQSNSHNNQIKATSQHVTQTLQTKSKPVEARTTSTSDSNSSSSDSSGSESGDDNVIAFEKLDTFSTKAYEPPPPPNQPTSKINSGGAMFMSTLHSDLQLSDSNSDSD